MMPVRNIVTDTFGTLFAFGMLAANAHLVVTYRTLGMIGHWSVEDDEHHRMVAEKPSIFLQAGLSATTAAFAGKDADQVTRAWIAPISDAVQSNRTRLERRGPAIMGANLKRG